MGVMFLPALSQKCFAIPQKLPTRPCGRTRNVRLRQGKVSKVPRQSLSRRIRPAKSFPQGKHRSIFREQYLHMIDTERAENDHAPLDGITAFFQAPPPRQIKTMTSSHSSPNGSDLESLNDPDAAQEEDDESESDASTYTSNRDINRRDNSKAICLHSASAPETSSKTLRYPFSITAYNLPRRFVFSMEITALKNTRKVKVQRIYEIIL